MVEDCGSYNQPEGGYLGMSRGLDFLRRLVVLGNGEVQRGQDVAPPN